MELCRKRGGRDYGRFPLPVLFQTLLPWLLVFETFEGSAFSLSGKIDILFRLLTVIILGLWLWLLLLSVLLPALRLLPGLGLGLWFLLVMIVL